MSERYHANTTVLGLIYLGGCETLKHSILETLVWIIEDGGCWFPVVVTTPGPAAEVVAIASYEIWRFANIPKGYVFLNNVVILLPICCVVWESRPPRVMHPFHQWPLQLLDRLWISYKISYI